MRLRLDLAYVDDLKIHDVAALATLPYALRSVRTIVEPRRQSRELANRHGSIDETKFYGGRTIDLAGYVDAPAGGAATEEAYDQLRARFCVPGEHVFRFRRKGRLEEEQVVFKQATGFDAPAEGDHETVRWAVSIFAGDPRIYGAALKSASYDPAAAAGSGGFAMPMTLPLVFAAGGAGTGLLEVTNAGTWSTPAIFTVRGPVVNPTVDLVETGEQLIFEGTLGASDTLEIDVRNRRVRLNGADRLDLLVAGVSTWFLIPAGTSHLRLGGSGHAIGQTQLAVAFRDARL